MTSRRDVIQASKRKGVWARWLTQVLIPLGIYDDDARR